MFTSYAQNFEDVMLRRALKHIARGFYIDVGAQDPIVDSVSMGFYEQGWRGVNVEPVAAYAARLRAERPDETVVEAALGANHGVLRLHEITGTGLSTADPEIAALHRRSGRLVREVDVPCVTLDEIMAPYAEIDTHWLKIDVEGYEAEVLRGWAGPVRPWIVVVESTHPSTEDASHMLWESRVIAHGYSFAYFDGLNRFYIHAEHEDLRPAFAHGPTAFDRFTLSGTSTSTFALLLRNQTDALKRAAEALKAEAQAAATRSRGQLAAAELRARGAAQRAEALQRHQAAMEATISWRVTRPLRWLSRHRTAMRRRCAHALRATTDPLIRLGVSQFKRTAFYARVAARLQMEHPRLWQRAKSWLAILSPRAPVVAAPWHPRTTRDSTIVAVAEVESRLVTEVRRRRQT